MRIAIDAMGGDHAPSVVLSGVFEAIEEFNGTIVLVGIKEQIETELKNYQYDPQKIEVVHASQVVDMHDAATVSIRSKKDSSISVGIKELKEKRVDAFISAGNTGAVVAASTIFLGMLEGCERPAIGTVIPSISGFSFIMDVGANTDPKAKHLLHSALLAKVYARDILGVKNPKIGLLNIGEEASKGSGFAKEAHKLMEGRVENFLGNVEANEVFTGKCDCIICDGYVGNIVLKVSEGLMESAGKVMKREIKKNPLAIVGAGILKLTLREFKKLVDYSEYGGAPLLGVNGLVMICHGRSNPKAIKNAIKATAREIEDGLIEAMVSEIKK